MHIEVIINARWNSFSHCFLINVSMIIISDNHISSSSRGLRTEFRLHKFLSSMEFLSLLRGKIQAGKNLWHRGEFEWYQQQSTYKKSYHSCYTNLPKSSCKVMTYFFCSYLPTPFMWRFGEAFLPATKTRGTKLKDINSPWASTADGWGTLLFSKPMRQSEGLSSPVKLRDWRMKCIHFSLISHFRTEFCLYIYIHIYEQFIQQI